MTLRKTITKTYPHANLSAFTKIFASLAATILVATTSLATMSTVLASTKKADKWYEVEVIVFANNNSSLLEEEKWPEKPGSPQTKNVFDLFTQTELLLDDVENLPMYYVEPSTPGENSLAPLVERIKASDQYSLIIHRTWRQIAPKKKDAAPVYLEDTNTETLYQNLSDDTLPAISPNDDLTTSSDNALNGGFSGTFSDNMPSDQTSGNLENNNDNIDEELSAEQLLLEALLAEEMSLEDDVSTRPFFIHELDPIAPFDEIDDFPISQPVELTPMGPPSHALFGTLQFFKNRYLHIAVDFSYRPAINKTSQEMLINDIFPMANIDELSEINDTKNNDETLSDGAQLMHFSNNYESPLSLASSFSAELATSFSFDNLEKSPLIGFRLKGSKRIRLNEVHYFDHPVYGIIVRATPYVEPEPEINDENTVVE